MCSHQNIKQGSEDAMCKNYIQCKTYGVQCKKLWVCAIIEYPTKIGFALEHHEHTEKTHITCVATATHDQNQTNLDSPKKNTEDDLVVCYMLLHLQMHLSIHDLLKITGHNNTT